MRRLGRDMGRGEFLLLPPDISDGGTSLKTSCVTVLFRESILYQEVGCVIGKGGCRYTGQFTHLPASAYIGRHDGCTDAD